MDTKHRFISFSTATRCFFVTFCHDIHLDIIFPIRPVSWHLYSMRVTLYFTICENHMWACSNLSIRLHKMIEKFSWTFCMERYKLVVMVNSKLSSRVIWIFWHEYPKMPDLVGIDKLIIEDCPKVECLINDKDIHASVFIAYSCRYSCYGHVLGAFKLVVESIDVSSLAWGVQESPVWTRGVSYRNRLFLWFQYIFSGCISLMFVSKLNDYKTKMEKWTGSCRNDRHRYMN